MSKQTGRLLLGVLWGLFFFADGVFPAPGDNMSGEEEMTRGAIPEALLRPQRGEAPRYPLDTVIGSLGRGEASEEAYLFAREVAAALIAGNPQAPSLQAMNSISLEAFISALNTISPRTYRLGSGREEPDGAVSFLVRFLGRERGIAGELYIRPPGDGWTARPPEAAPSLEGAGAAGTPEEAGQSETAGAAGEAEPAGLTEAAPSLEGAGTAGAPEEAGQSETAGLAAARVSPDPAVWQFEDLILEEARERGVEADHRFEFPPYERFF
ncbi:MAG: hypothetical protein LBL19_07130 [Spirochaetaceae bacterium]|nr:hypothetical protein [Spirochaetaceae bacterium]